MMLCMLVLVTLALAAEQAVAMPERMDLVGPVYICPSNEPICESTFQSVCNESITAVTRSLDPDGPKALTIELSATCSVDDTLFISNGSDPNSLEALQQFMCTSGDNLFSFNITESNGFHLGFSSNNSCINVTILSAFYYQCVSATMGLAVFGPVAVGSNSSGTCVNNTNGTSPSAMCNPDGTFTVSAGCSCAEGYNDTSDPGMMCSDINECTMGSYSCNMNAICINTIGSYTCECNAGFTGDGFSCSDTNECEVNSSICGANSMCNNADGSYTCICESGYTGMNCEDINECEVNPSICGANSMCNDTDGSYTCMCESGYTGQDGMNCKDIDECETDKYCGVLALCNNIPGSVVCSCPEGYTGADSDKEPVCTDIDECENDPCGANSMCENTIGNYTCICEQGFSGGNCDDNDECAEGVSNNCSADAECDNNQGSYTCVCNPGYTGDGTSCTNIMCSLEETCHADADCSIDESSGKPTCECKDGYVGNGTYCTEAAASFPQAAVIGAVVGGVVVAILVVLLLIVLIVVCRMRVNRQGFYETYEDKAGAQPNMLRYSASLRSITSQTVVPVDGRPSNKENEFYV